MTETRSRTKAMKSRIVRGVAGRNMTMTGQWPRRLEIKSRGRSVPASWRRGDWRESKSEQKGGVDAVARG
jgi:hypothetical protein